MTTAAYSHVSTPLLSLAARFDPHSTRHAPRPHSVMPTAFDRRLVRYRSCQHPHPTPLDACPPSALAPPPPHLLPACFVRSASLNAQCARPTTSRVSQTLDARRLSSPLDAWPTTVDALRLWARRAQQRRASPQHLSCPVGCRCQALVASAEVGLDRIAESEDDA